MNKTQALILFAHGARDPRWAGPFQRLQKMTQGASPDIVVELAFLEFMSPALPELVRRLTEEGIRNISVTPIFLGQGGHVLRDLPVLLDQLREEYPALELKLATAVGEDETVLKAIRDYCLSQI